MNLDKRLRTYLLALIILALLLGIWIVPVEYGNKINTIGDGLWWAITTITGVGYGDVVPVTGLGRVFCWPVLRSKAQGSATIKSPTTTGRCR